MHQDVLGIHKSDEEQFRILNEFLLSDEHVFFEQLLTYFALFTKPKKSFSKS